MKTDKNIKESVLLSGLAMNVKEILISSGRSKKWVRGEMIVSEGDTCKGLSLLLCGVAAVQKYTPAGEYSTIRLLNAGDCFGEELVFAEDKRYSCMLEAVSDVELLTIPIEQFRNLMDTYPEIKERFYLVILKRIESQDLSIMILSQKTVRQKISYYLLSLSREQKSEQVALPVSKEVIAKLLAIPRQSFSRELSRMESEGRIKVEGRTIGIIDLPSLEREIGVV